MSGGSKQSTQTENKQTAPWAPAVPGLQSILSKTTGLLDSGTGSGIYTGERYAGLGSDTIAGLDATKTGAAAGAGVAQAGNGFATGLLANGGTTAGTNAATSGLAGVDPTVDTSGVGMAASALSNPNGVPMTTGAGLANGGFGTNAGALVSAGNGLLGGQTQTRASLQRVADGGDLGGSAQLEALISRSQNDAASAAAQKMAASGRYGSGRFNAAVADAVDGVGTNLRYTDLQNQQARQASAASAIDAADNARASTGAGLLSTASGINAQNGNLAATGAGLVQNSLNAGLAGQQALFSDQSDNTNRALSQAGTLLSGAQSDRAAGLAGIAAMPTVQAALLNPGKTLAGTGAILDQDRQSQDDAAQALFSDQQNNPWKGIGLASSIVDPIAGLGGTSSGTTITKTPQPSFLQQLLGTALVGANVYSKVAGGGAGA